MKTNFCNCNFVLILFKEYGNLLKEHIETFQCAPTSAPMRSELCMCMRDATDNACAFSLHTRHGFVNVFFFAISVAQIIRKKRCETRDVEVVRFIPFQYCPWTSVRIRSLLQAD